MNYKIRELEIKDWFKNHIAEYSIYKDSKGSEIESIKWHQPGTTCYYIRYLRLGRTLMIMGDLGEAIHIWGSEAPLSFIARCNLYYFAEKCQASEEGRSPMVWDEKEAKFRLKEYFKENNFEEMLCNGYPDDNVNNYPEEFKEFENNFWKHGFNHLNSNIKDISWATACEDGILDQIDSVGNFAAWINNDLETAEKYLGQDLWEFAYDIGMVFTYRCQSHLIGLKTAMEQINKNNL